MTINDFITEVYCFIDDDYKKLVKNLTLRSRGFSPRLSGSEIIAMKVVGEYLGHNKDTHIWKYFKNNRMDMFLAIGSRCNIVKQAANLWHIKQLLHSRLIEKYFSNSAIHIIDGFSIPICHYVRSSKCKSFKGIASYGYCTAKDEKYYGFKGHIIIDSNGVINYFTASAANVDERIAMLDICNNIKGLLIGD